MAEISDFEPRLLNATATIANGASITDTVDSRGLPLRSITRNAASVANASYALLGSNDGTNFYRVTSVGGTDVAITVGASRAVHYVPADAAQSARYYKLDGSLNESADVTFTFTFGV